jgi:hypothetical protein
MDTQTAYEKIRAHFTNDPRLGYDVEEGNCSYKTSDGRRCALGCLLPEGSPLENYIGGIAIIADSPITLGQLATDLGVSAADLDPDADGDLYKFLYEAQMHHDDQARQNRDEMGAALFLADLDRIADQFGLQVVSV